MSLKGMAILLVCIAAICFSCGCVETTELEESVEGVHTFNIDTVTEKLPPKPETFDLIKRNFYDSQIDDFTALECGMWKTPEFYPTWERSGIKTFTDHDYSRWGVHGYGFFPSAAVWDITNMQKGDEITFHTFLHTSWGVETWQGIKLEPIYDETLFDVYITPDEFYLEPTYPVFYPEWTKMLEFKVVAKDEIPYGTYTISVKIGSPSNALSEEWSWEVLEKFTEEKYKTEIDKCKSNYDSEMCDKFVILRQNKYVSGSMFTPSNVYVSYITVS